MDSMIRCRICDNTHDNRVYTAREMMYGSREKHDYFECSECGCVQIIDIPPDMSKYYSDNYYSLSVDKENRLKRFLKRHRASQAMGKNTYVGKFLLRVWGEPPVVLWLRPTGVHLQASILDVGCGAGQLLLDMSNIGYSDLTGIDPFVDQDHTSKSGLQILRRELSEMDGLYDLITFHHSFEHMPDPASVFAHLHRLLNNGGKALVRVPVAGTHAWNTFKTDWVQLDAPRHFFLHTERSIQILAERSGFVIENVIYDSSGFQFWASIQIQQDIPLRDPRSYGENPRRSFFSREEIEEFERLALELNAMGEGDQACFYLRKNAS